MTTAATLTQIDLYNFVHKFDNIYSYNNACYNIEILIKLMTFFIQRLQTFFKIFVTFLRFLNVFILIGWVRLHKTS